MKYMTLLAAGLSLCFSAQASAQISEIRIGVTEFDERTIKFGWGAGGGRENSIGINGEVIFDKPDMLRWALSPRPYIGGMVNLEGDTSYVGGGLTWRQEFSDRFYGDLAIGIVVHDGEKNLFSNSNRRREDFATLLARSGEEISFGSRYLFRPAATLGYRVNDDWAGEVFFEHLSNGFTATVNDGVDNIGFRAARRF